jgi:ubiquinol-cytochrome c reductase iron-sulfur subunit
MSRRDFLKLLAAAGTVMTFAPFVDWGKFLPNTKTAVAEKAKVMLPDGSQANIHTFPVNHSEVVIYPKTDDQVLNKESFRTWQLIRLPTELQGNVDSASSFRLYSMVCLHLWCLWRYVPRGPSKIDPSKMVNGNGQCPCHGSMYDPLTGKAYEGPASLQGPPSNALPRLDIEADSKGDLWILPPTWDLRKNGIVGYGRYLA